MGKAEYIYSLQETPRSTRRLISTILANERNLSNRQINAIRSTVLGLLTHNDQSLLPAVKGRLKNCKVLWRDVGIDHISELCADQRELMKPFSETRSGRLKDAPKGIDELVLQVVDVMRSDLLIFLDRFCSVGEVPRVEDHAARFIENSHLSSEAYKQLFVSAVKQERVFAALQINQILSGIDPDGVNGRALTLLQLEKKIREEGRTYNEDADAKTKTNLGNQIIWSDIEGRDPIDKMSAVLTGMNTVRKK